MKFLDKILIVLFLFFCSQVEAKELKGKKLKPDDISAVSAIVIDAKTGLVLFEKNPDKKLYPASITKILTCYIACEKCKNINKKVVVSRKAAYGIEPGSSSIALKPGEIVRIKDVLYALMLRSANECGNVLAEYISGSNKNFSVLMNDYIKKWGLKNTHFVNPHGLPNKNHYTSARDMAVIARMAMKNKLFRKIVRTKVYPFPSTNKHKAKERGKLYNKNRMLFKRRKEYYEGCIGIKGGYTTKALHTFVAAAKRGDKEIIAVVMKVRRKKQMYEDLKKLLDYGFEKIKKRLLVKKGEKVFEKKSNNFCDTLIGVAKKNIYSYLPENAKIEKVVEVRKNISLPVKKGEKLGSISFYVNNVFITKTDFFANERVAKKFSYECIKKNKKIFLSIVFIIIFFIIFLISKIL